MFFCYFSIDAELLLLQCQEDAECSFGTSCTFGFCEGDDCVKCKLFRREESANGCIKEIKNCGPCLSG
jgi:hypothetical protein